MHVYRLTKPHPYLESIQTWYKEAFPVDERRQFSDLLTMLSCPDMYLCALIDQTRLVGFIIYWTLSDIIFIEHLAIDPALRGQQFGRQALNYVLEMPSQYCVLEVERPIDELSQRRIRFYKRAGFTVAPLPYLQPPYQPDKLAVPMYLMVIPAIPTEDEFVRLTSFIREQVYERFYVRGQ